MQDIKGCSDVVSKILDTFTEDNATSLDTVALLIEQSHDDLSIAVGFTKDEWDNLKGCVSGTSASCGKENLENIVNKLIEYEKIKNPIGIATTDQITNAKKVLQSLNGNTNEDTTFTKLKTQMADIKDKFKDVPESV